MKKIAVLACGGLFISLTAYSTEQNDKIDANKDETKVTLEIASEEIKNVGVKTENIKIDDNTTAKITIATKEQSENIDVNNTTTARSQEDNKTTQNTQPENDNKEDKTSLLEKSKQLITNSFSNNEANNTQNINIQGNYDINKANVIKLQDGVKNININFQPNINVGCDKNCQDKKKNIKVEMQTNKQSQNQVKQQKANKKIKSKTTKMNKKKSVSKIKNGGDNKKASNILVETTPVYTKSSNQTHKSLRKIYENNELSCIGDECNNIAVEAKEFNGNEMKKINGNEMKTDDMENNNATHQNNNVTPSQIIIKEQQPVYVINRIINMDNDMKLSDATIQKIAQEQTGNITVVNDGNNFSPSVSGEDKFKQRYDIIASNDISYGEVAFVDDYND